MGYALKGVGVTVLSPTSASFDPFGAPVAGVSTRTEVGNVLVDNPTDEEIEQSTRQFGVSCDLLLHFPKTCHMALRGCSVSLPEPWDATFEVLGDPMPYDPKLTPGAHDRKVHVRRVVG